MSLWVNNRNLTRVLDEPSDTVSNGVTVPVTAIAHWMVRNAHGIVFEEAPTVARRYGNGEHEIIDRWNRDEAPPGTDQDSWEDARYDWYCRHFWLAGAEGAMLPVTLYCTDWYPKGGAGRAAPLLVWSGGLNTRRDGQNRSTTPSAKAPAGRHRYQVDTSCDGSGNTSVVTPLPRASSSL